MFGIGTGEVLLILIIATLVVGPEEMVAFARDLGQLLAKFRQETDSVTEEFREVLSMQPGTAGTQEAETKDAVGALESGEATKVAAAEEGMPTEEVEVTKEAEVQKQPADVQRAFVDGEMETFSLEEEEDEEKPVLIVVGEPVPKDEDVEPIVIEEPVLVVDEGGNDTEEKEG